ncbi:hypothetical protein LMG24238_02400 [Paraburkholderia sediminicola]|uniref:DUF3331 domain-containing protein n=1 Tax=Paraburkholderia sediminicola TaxID=458836 RepID=A0A6J5AP84_9BURK|nr:DUF3331 domain-containing protein [Paraburkholderia sediminicola]CAB3676737.1 hypothetical protein LMG24238_02400 [Paraburkholderia sediminicola]
MINHFEPWERIVGTLLKEPGVCVLPVSEAAHRGELPRAARDGVAEYPIATVQKGRSSIAVQAVERQNDRAMLLSWSDATRGHFGDQRWISAKSRCKGRCVLTGSVIRRGDTVYRLQRRGSGCTTIGSEMILAVALGRMAEQDAVI